MWTDSVQLGDFFHVDMTAKKAWIKTTVVRVLEEMDEDDDENEYVTHGRACDTLRTVQIGVYAGVCH